MVSWRLSEFVSAMNDSSVSEFEKTMPAGGETFDGPAKKGRVSSTHDALGTMNDACNVTGSRVPEFDPVKWTSVEKISGEDFPE